MEIYLKVAPHFIKNMVSNSKMQANGLKILQNSYKKEIDLE